jgi:hypothetical protein
MTEAGIAADRNFIVRESARLEDLITRLSALHLKRYGVQLDRGDPTLRQWIYGALRLAVPRGASPPG